MNVDHKSVISRMRLRDEAKLRATKLGEVSPGKLIVVFDDTGQSAGAYLTVGLMPFALSSPWKNVMYCQVINPMTGTLAQFDAEARVQTLEGAHIAWECKTEAKYGDGTVTAPASGQVISLRASNFASDSMVDIDADD